MKDTEKIELSASALAQACARSMYKNDSVAKRLEINIADVQPGYAELRMAVRDDMLDAGMACHEGLIFTLADTAFAYACNTHNETTVAASCAIEYLDRVAAGESLLAVAREQWRRGRNGVCDVRVSDRSGRSVAVFRGKSFSLGTPLIESESSA